MRQRLGGLAVLALVVTFLGSVRGAAAGVVQGPVLFNGSNYFLIDQTDWANAEAQAVALGGHLATVDNAAENQFITDTFAVPNAAASLGVWIGLNDIAVEGQFLWTSGTPVSYTNWHTGEPNNGNGVNADEDAVEIYGALTPGTWNDDATSTKVIRFGVAEVAVGTTALPLPPALWISLLGLAPAALVVRRCHRRPA